MQKLKQELLGILRSAKNPKSVEAEADQILFQAFRLQSPTLRSPGAKISDLHRLLAEEKIRVDQTVRAEAIRLARARAQGQLLQHLLQHQYFLNHEYLVNDAVLVPRPETEILVDAAIRLIEEKITRAGQFKFAELGLGSGIISSEILAYFKNSRGCASEASAQAIAVAHQNFDTILGSRWGERLQIFEPQNESVGFEIFESQAPFDFIFSNPPYVSVQDEIESEVLAHEPHAALFPSVTPGEQENPNYFYENFLRVAPQILAPAGIAFFEIPHERAEVLAHAFKNAGFSRVNLHPDLTGRPRVLIAQKKAN
jgi:release factor glutamine methyltransferase